MPTPEQRPISDETWAFLRKLPMTAAAGLLALESMLPVDRWRSTDALIAEVIERGVGAIADEFMASEDN